MAGAGVSPKRKRGQDAPGPALQAGLQIPQHRLQSDERTGDDGSPQTVVAGRFERLDLAYDGGAGSEVVDERERKRRAQPVEIGCEPPTPTRSPRPRHAAEPPPSDEAVRGVPFTFEHVDIMPEPGSSAGSGRPKSPTLPGAVNDLYWSDAEITGHDPDDPLDDGYGINGIGFRPTPGQAHQRSQRRKQQLAEYRSRENKEARQRRSERRRMESVDGKKISLGEEHVIKVHFEDQ